MSVPFDFEPEFPEILVEWINAPQENFESTMEEHPRCALLPSPEKLDESIVSPGSDKTNTMRDFDLIKKWVEDSGLLNTGFFEAEGGYLEDVQYNGFISSAFSTAFDAMRNTASPDLEELVFWYYAGHGLSKEAAQKLSYSSTPCLSNLDNLVPEYNAVANDYVTEGRKVKGGELCLHKVGFCDLYGLLKPWIAAVKGESINAKRCSKKNKHLAIILDSCYSGIIAQELKDFEKKMNEQDSNFLKENSVTIQAACGSDEGTFGGYFTPTFVYLKENAVLLNRLKGEWRDMTDEVKNEYKALELPSPIVVTTRNQSQDFQDVTMELTIQNLNLTLFPDPGFFKFCFIKVYQHQDPSLFERALTGVSSAVKFMTSTAFTVLDYKLKTYRGHGLANPHHGTPMGLFLLEDPMNPDYAVCAHIHFQTVNTSMNPQRINLVHHKKSPLGIMPFHVRYSYKEEGNKFQVPSHIDTQNLVNACHDYVESKEPGRWKNVSQWNMPGILFGVNGLFRVPERLKQRSAWEDSYLKHIEKFNLPKDANN